VSATGPAQREARKQALQQASLAQRRELQAQLGRLAGRADRLEADLRRLRAALLSPLGLLGAGLLGWLAFRSARRIGPGTGVHAGRSSRARWLPWIWQAWRLWRGWQSR